jgi:PRTRC genetic system protein D
MHRVGVDIGFGYSKLVWLEEGDKFRERILPSVYGRAVKVRKMDLGLGEASRRRVFRLTYQGQEYLMGSDALLHSELGVNHRQDFGRIGSDTERILLLALLAKAGLTDVAIVTGLPVLAWDKRHLLKKSWEGEHEVILGSAEGRGRRNELTITVREVRMAWQPVLSLYDYALDVKDGQPVLAGGMTEELLRKGWAIIDVGHNTTDVAGVINLQPIEKFSGGSRFGGREVLAEVQRAIRDKWGVTRQLAEIEAAVRRGYIDVYEHEEPLTELAQSAAGGLATEIVSDVSGLLDDGSRFHGILLTGGPAPLIQPALAGAYPRNLVLMRDSQIANARGGCKFAQGPVFKFDG